MPEYRASVDAQSPLTAADRGLLVAQAKILIEDLYAHLPLKQAMHAVEPVQRLKLLDFRAHLMDDLEFHAELLDIFISLRDLHTNYGLPSPYANRVAFLGVLVERYTEAGSDRYMVSKINANLVTEPTLTPGVELTHFAGMPMELAVWRNAQREAGSNVPARRARGLQKLTLRNLGRSLPPEEDWVDVRYLVDGRPHEARLLWRVFEIQPPTPAAAPAPSGRLVGLGSPPGEVVGVDLGTEVIREVRKQLFAPAAMREAARVARSVAAVPRITPTQKAAGIVPTSRPQEITAKIVTTSHGTFGYLRLWSFLMEDGKIEEFVDEVIRLLEDVFPPEGLIIDVRGNGGGYLIAAEYLLQLICPRRIDPEPTQFINRPGTLELCSKVASMAGWQPSIAQATETGAQFSAALPLSPVKVVNAQGQIYHGPVALVTDAFCYSACDTFAAGFADHEIGPVLGIDPNTGAGGANVLEHVDLVKMWTGGPLRTLPAGATMRVALRRTLRVGAAAGQPVEDLGIVPAVLHDITRADLLEDNVDLIEHAGALLAARTPRVLEVTVTSVTGVDVELAVTTRAVSSVDVYVDDRPQASSAIATPDGSTTVHVTLLTPAKGTIRLQGFVADKLVASRLVVLE